MEGITGQSYRQMQSRCSCIPNIKDAERTLRMQRDLSTGQKNDVRWRRTPGRRRKTWYCQIWGDVGMSPRNY